jgi:hypothetical protein
MDQWGLLEEVDIMSVGFVETKHPFLVINL